MHAAYKEAQKLPYSSPTTKKTQKSHLLKLINEPRISLAMAKGRNSATFFLNLLLLLVLLGSFVFVSEARSLKPVQNKSSIEMEIMKVLDDLYVAAVKTGGPSNGGDGHATITRALSLDGIKKSGPSPGSGN